jgi:hypothetical protein
MSTRITTRFAVAAGSLGLLLVLYGCGSAPDQEATESSAADLTASSVTGPVCAGTLTCTTFVPPTPAALAPYNCSSGVRWIRTTDNTQHDVWVCPTLTPTPAGYASLVPSCSNCLGTPKPGYKLIGTPQVVIPPTGDPHPCGATCISHQ